MKLDMKKAYDTIKWDFLEERLVGLKLQKKFIDLIIVYVRSPKFTLVINGSTNGYFSSKRGLRQGDLIAPLLLVLCIEYMLSVMKKISSCQGFGLHVRCKALQLTYMAFVDDIILCCESKFPSVYHWCKLIGCIALVSCITIDASFIYTEIRAMSTCFSCVTTLRNCWWCCMNGWA